MKPVLLDYRTHPEIIKTLKRLKFEVVFSIKQNNLATPVNGHPDLQLIEIDKECCIVDPSIFDEISFKLKLVKGSDYKIIKGKTTVSEKYPFDIRYNVLRIGNFAFGRFEFIDQMVIDELITMGFEIIKVKQGYSRCSVAKVSERAAITSDVSLAKVMKSKGIDVLVLDPGGVVLDGYEYGFVGGASGLYTETISSEKTLRTLFLTGKYKDESTNKKIHDFCESHGTGLVFLSEEEITDFGGLIFL